MRWALIGLGLLALSGCARFPDIGVAPSTRLIFTFNVQGAIRTGQEPGGTGVPYVYLVAVRTTDDPNPTTQGPIPIIAPPWGNGFVAGNATHYIAFDPTQANDFLIYRFRDATLNEWEPVGVPISAENVNVGSRRIRFEIDLLQLTGNDQAAADALRTLQVNLLTMDRIPSGSGGSKQWDALGDGRLPSQVNQFLNIPLQRAGTYTNASAGNLEPVGDTPNPDLDLSDFTIEVRRD